MRRPDPQRSFAVLIGTSSYRSAELPDLPSVRNNLTGLVDVLTDPVLGGLPAERCVVLQDESDVRTVYRTLRQYALLAEDTLIVYIAGHGRIGQHNELYLSLTDTDPDELQVSALRYELVRDVFADCPADNRVIILDCCFSGLAVRDMSADPASSLVVAGTYVLTATPATAVALAPRGETYTAFTGALLGLLRDGVPGGPEYLTFGTLYPRLLHHMIERRLPRPQQRGTGLTDRLALTRNPAYTTENQPVIPAAPAPAPAPRPPRDRAAMARIASRIAAGAFAVFIAVAAPLIPVKLGGDGSGASSGSSTSPAPSSGCPVDTLGGAGSSGQADAMADWIAEYQRRCAAATINYTPTGSGAGIHALYNGTVDFAGYDGVLSDSDRQQVACRPLVLPMVIKPIAVIYNLDGVASLNLRPTTIAKIFSGAIRTWDAPEIGIDNLGVTLPPTPITAVHRSDATVVTTVFTGYLEATAAKDWTSGGGTAWKAPGGTGAANSDGMAATVQGTSGAIGYVEWRYTTDKHLTVANLGHGGANEFTKFTPLDHQSVTAAVNAAKLAGTGTDLTLSIDYTLADAAAYPLVTVVYEIVCGQSTRAERRELLKSFLGYLISPEGQGKMLSLGCVPLPEPLRSRVETAITALS